MSVLFSENRIGDGGEDTETGKKGTGSGNFVTKVVKLADLVDYQEGAVVSRSMLKKKAGTVTLFAFDHGQGLNGHTTPFDAMVYLLDGEAEMVVSRKIFHLEEGDMVIIPEQRLYSLRAVNRFKMLLTTIDTG
ncbi:MAG: cupin domain-containing protein [Chloroflexota bacterium]